MTTSITPVQMWKCSITGKLFDTPEKAEKSQRSAKAAATRKKNKEKKEKEVAKLIEYQSNYIRLNATSVDDIPSLMMKKAKEFWGINICVTFEQTRFSHRVYRSGGSSEQPGFGFRIRITGKTLGKVQLDNLKNLGCSVERCNSIGDTIIQSHWWHSNPAAFKGVQLGSGSGGRFEDSGTGLNMDATILLSDFPLIDQKYQQYLLLKGPVEEWNRKVDQINKSARSFTNRTRLVSNQAEVCSAIREKLDKETELLRVLTHNAEKEYKKFCHSKLPEPPLIPCELISMFS